MNGFNWRRWVKAEIIKVGLTIVDLNEPRASDEQAKRSVSLAWLQKIPLYLYWELKNSIWSPQEHAPLCKPQNGACFYRCTWMIS